MKQIEQQLKEEENIIKALNIEIIKQEKENDTSKEIEEGFEKKKIKIDNQIKSLENEKKQREEKLNKSEEKEKQISRQKQIKEEEINSLKAVDKTANNIKKTVDNNNKYNEELELGFQHEEKFEKFQESFNEIQSRKDELKTFLNQTQQYIQQCNGMIEDLKRKIKQAEQLQKHLKSLFNAEIQQRFKQIMGIEAYTIDSYALIRQILFNVDGNLEQFIQDNNLTKHFEKLAQFFANKLELLQNIKSFKQNEDDNSQTIDDFIDDRFDELLVDEKTGKILELEQNLAVLQKELKEINNEIKEAQNEKNKEEEKGKKQEKKVKEKAIKEATKQLKDEERVFRLSYKNLKLLISRVVNYLKSSVDNLAHSFNQYKLINPLQKQIKYIAQALDIIKRTSLLSITHQS